jgi:hypothetical protein
VTHDDIIRMAAEAGFIIDQESRQFQPNCISHTHHVIDEQLTRFAELVAAFVKKDQRTSIGALLRD